MAKSASGQGQVQLQHTEHCFTYQRLSWDWLFLADVQLAVPPLKTILNQHNLKKGMKNSMKIKHLITSLIYHFGPRKTMYF